jgi:hypothetical protein
MTVTRLSAEQRRTLKLLASSRDGANEDLLRRLVMTSTCGLPLGAAWSGYGCKPAVRLTRSASLFLTHRRHLQTPVTADTHRPCPSGRGLISRSEQRRGCHPYPHHAAIHSARPALAHFPLWFPAWRRREGRVAQPACPT